MSVVTRNSNLPKINRSYLKNDKNLISTVLLSSELFERKKIIFLTLTNMQADPK